MIHVTHSKPHHPLFHLSHLSISVFYQSFPMYSKVSTVFCKTLLFSILQHHLHRHLNRILNPMTCISEQLAISSLLVSKKPITCNPTREDLILHGNDYHILKQYELCYMDSITYVADTGASNRNFLQISIVFRSFHTEHMNTITPARHGYI